MDDLPYYFIAFILHICRHLDTSYIDVDVNPAYVRVTIKGKILQLTLPYEVSVERSNVRRNTTTGSLVVTMARLIPSAMIVKKHKETQSKREAKIVTIRPPMSSRRAFLEIGPPTDLLDLLRITEDPVGQGRKSSAKAEKKERGDFEDNPDVPPLE